MLVAADCSAAITQLEVLGERLGIGYAEHGVASVAVCRKAVDEARRSGAEVVILDTAGQLRRQP